MCVCVYIPACHTQVKFSENIDFQYPMKRACEKEIQMYCKDVPHGEARVIRCLQENKRMKDFGKECRDEVRVCMCVCARAHARNHTCFCMFDIRSARGRASLCVCRGSGQGAGMERCVCLCVCVCVCVWVHALV